MKARQEERWRENEWAYGLSVKCPLKKRPLSGAGVDQLPAPFLALAEE